ncbi:MAG: type II secretion system minor pseudopilin GspI [Gammaproteobacteria bacterium]|nr:type II secretion system minor pseudopilin GspI [Gammaproteobacteria bacterium]
MTARGFTLLEVLVALAVVAIALAAAVKAVGVNADNAAYLRDKTIAHWIALNRITEQQLLEEWPSPGTSSGTAAMAGNDWSWEVTVSETSDSDVRKIVAGVGYDTDPGSILTSVTGYLTNTWNPGE